MSADFFRELIAPHFDIDNLWDRTSQKGSRINAETINQNEYVVFWQRLNPLPDCEKIRAKIIWVPMYDSISFDYLFWKNLSFLPIKIICFSKIIYKQCQKFGIESIYVQYFSKPAWEESVALSGTKNAFLWYRGPISFSMIKKIINPDDINSFTYLSRPDPNYKKENITTEEKSAFKIKLLEMDFKESKKEYMRLVKESGLFIAPRKKEGIGLSFIEAMALGSVVVAHNDGTMNEYIEHGHNGFLFDADEKNPKKIDLTNIAEVLKNSKAIAQKGYQKWLDQEKNIIEFLKTDCARKPLIGVVPAFWKKIYAFKLWQFKMRIKYL